MHALIENNVITALRDAPAGGAWEDIEAGIVGNANVVGVLRHQLPRRFDHRVDVDRRHRLNPDSASRDHVRATHRHVHHHPVT